MGSIRLTLFGILGFLSSEPACHSTEIADLANSANLLRYSDAKDWTPAELCPEGPEKHEMMRKDLLDHHEDLMGTMKNNQ